MAKTKLIIVCDEKTEQYANYLRQLISTNDDKDGEVKGVVDGSVEAAVWLDKEYIANKATISSSEHILFIGDNKVSKISMMLRMKVLNKKRPSTHSTWSLVKGNAPIKLTI